MRSLLPLTRYPQAQCEHEVVSLVALEVIVVLPVTPRGQEELVVSLAGGVDVHLIHWKDSVDFTQYDDI